LALINILISTSALATRRIRGEI